MPGQLASRYSLLLIDRRGEQQLLRGTDNGKDGLVCCAFVSANVHRDLRLSVSHFGPAPL